MRDKIWLTAHTRMVTEARHLWSAKLWDLLVIWYSTAMVIASVIALKETSGSNSSYLLVSLSIGVLALSIYVPTLGHKVNADKHRSCYLRLQELLDTAKDGDLAKEYHSILAEYPNHKKRDWFALLVTAKFEGTPLKVRDKEISVECWHHLVLTMHRVFDVIFWTTLFLAPLVIFQAL